MFKICSGFVLHFNVIQSISGLGHAGLELESVKDGMYRGTQLDGLSAGDTIRVNGYIPCLTELYKAYHCSLSTFHHGRSINLAAANAETVEIGFLP